MSSGTAHEDSRRMDFMLLKPLPSPVNAMELARGSRRLDDRRSCGGDMDACEDRRLEPPLPLNGC